MTTESEFATKEKSNPTEKSTSSEHALITKRGKKSNIEEDYKVLRRDVTVLKRDCQTLKERVDKLELQLPMASSTPTKTPSTISAQDDRSEKQIDHHRGAITNPHYTPPSEPDHKQHNSEYNPGYTHHNPGYTRHDPGYMQCDSGYRPHDPGYRQHYPAYRLHDPTYRLVAI